MSESTHTHESKKGIGEEVWGLFNKLVGGRSAPPRLVEGAPLGADKGTEAAGRPPVDADLEAINGSPKTHK